MQELFKRNSCRLPAASFQQTITIRSLLHRWYEYQRQSIFIKLVICITIIFQSCSSEKADTIFYNGNIYTVDSAFSNCEAFAVLDGKIISTGTSKELLAKYSNTELIDLKGKTVIPGFNDAHSHFYGLGITLSHVDLTGTNSYQEVIDRVVKFRKDHPESAWIQGRGWDQNDWTDKNFPDKKILDSLFPGIPVFLKRIDGHAALVNQLALNLAKITDSTKIKGGEIKKVNGKLTGVLVDNAVDIINAIVPQASVSEKVRAIYEAQQLCFENGLTSVTDAGLDKEIIMLYDSLQKKGKLKIRIYAMLNPNQENFEYFIPKGPWGSDKLNVRSFKIYADGALGSRGACLMAPYSDQEGHYGFLLNSIDSFNWFAGKLSNSGYQMNTHCIGDSANRLMLNLYSSVLKNNNDLRWRIEHAQVLNKNDFSIFKKYRIVPSVQPTHATSDMYWAEDRLGKERIKNAYAYKMLLDQLGIIALGTDFPVEKVSPFHTFYAATNRKDLKGFPENGFQKENALSNIEALKGMTIWPAWASFEEKSKGSIEPGKWADFIILDKDIIKEDPSGSAENFTIATYVAGKKVYQK